MAVPKKPKPQPFGHGALGDGFNGAADEGGGIQSNAHPELADSAPGLSNPITQISGWLKRLNTSGNRRSPSTKLDRGKAAKP